MKKGKKGMVVWWGSVGGFLLVFFLTATILLNSSLLYGVVCSVLGGERPRFADGVEPIYSFDYGTKTEVLRAANELNQEVASEGMVLLKNENGALPLAKNSKVSVFGQNSVNLAYGGSGSGAADKSADEIIDLYESLDHAGFDVNPTLKRFYENSGYKRTRNSSNLDDGDTVFLSTGEAPQSAYTAEVKSSYAQYSDAAIVLFTRIGGEGFDLPRSMAGQAGARNADDHYLQLDQNETDLLKAVCEAEFKKVIVVLNTGSAMELGFLEDSDYYAYQSKIDAAIWIGFPGATGAEALGKALNGEVNPSGRTTDTYVTNLKDDPSWQNFGDNRKADGDRYTLNGNKTLYYFVNYEEGVYVGYKYYETRGYTDGEAWYDAAVVYPFGYGKSYTSFSWELDDVSAIRNVTVAEGQKYTVKVKVTNTGDCAGKDVVQLYAGAPYTENGIEKPYKTLVGFAKTPLLKPNESAVVSMEFDPYYLASYDYKDLNRNGFAGYELEGGEYHLFVSADAHDAKFTIPFSVGGAGIRYEYDTVNGEYSVANRYTDLENQYFNSDLLLSEVTVNGEKRKGMSRTNWENTFPTAPAESDYALTQELANALEDRTPNNPNDYSEEEMPLDGEPVTITFRDMLSDKEGNQVGYVDYDDERWETLLDECKIEDLIDMYDNGNFKSNGVLNIGKPLTNDTDGPAGFTNFMDKTGTYWGTCHYCAETVMASTWNTELIEALGKMVGNEGLIGAAGRGNKLPYSGWYAPGVNIHRSAFGGRNFEYFSEDGFLAGKMAAAEIRGCRSKGVYCFVKHFALNEQETHRSVTGNITWATEQAMREIYLRPFEIAVKEGGATAVMSSFNRIGTRWTGGDYRLLTEILRNEWGFKGMVICDFNTIPQYMNSRQMAYAGGDLNLATQPVSWCDSSDVSDVIVLRQSAKNVFYTVANSNAMNAEIVGYGMPVWRIALIAVDCAVFVGVAVWGFFAIRKAIKKE